ncbi:MAG: DNA-processing protein DprA [Kiritimatiellia bacterium]
MPVTEREAYIALNMMDRVGPVRVRAMAEELGSVAAIFEASDRDLRAVDGVGPVLARSIIEQRQRIDPVKEASSAQARGVQLVTPVDREYPESLRDIHDPPLALYVRGRLRPTDRQAVAVVGTRHPTHYGVECAQKLSFGMAKAGLCVLSGLALGVDTAAHDGALRAHGRTIAVIGGGFDHLYPQENIGLADKIAESGAVISEFPFGRKPDRTTFPMRNRIVSGMSKGVLVIEAGVGSGAMITANQASEQGRSVFAVPGRIDSYASQGPNALIKDGAFVVTELRDLLEHFELLFPEQRDSSGATVALEHPGLNEQERKVVELLRGGEMGVDRLIRESGVLPSAMASLLIGMELKKVVKMLPGRSVALLH